MDIGPEQEPFIAEPVHDPFKAAPAEPDEQPAKKPTPEPEPVPST